VEIRTGATTGTLVYAVSLPGLYADSLGGYRVDMGALGLLAGSGSLTNGNYFWRVRGRNPRYLGTWSDYGNFLVNLQVTPDGASSLGGNVDYYGLAPTTGVVVQAFKSLGFSGHPDAQVTLNGMGDFRLMGLRAGTYYVRGFMDQNANGRLDAFEPWGFVREEAYSSSRNASPYMVPLDSLDLKLVLRDRDTNGNRIPDGWEFAASSSNLGDFDTNGDGLSDRQAVARGLDPWRLDTDGDGSVDAIEIAMNTDPADWTSQPAEDNLLEITGALFGPAANTINFNFLVGVVATACDVVTWMEGSPAMGAEFVEIPGSHQVIPSGSGFATGPYVFVHNHGGASPAFYRVRWKISVP